MKQVLVRYGERRALSEIFQVSCVTVWTALSGRGNSEICRKIRRAALNRGGVEVNN